MNARSLISVSAVLFALVAAREPGASAQCCGDCNGNGSVTIDELVRAVHFALDGCSDGGPCGRFPATGQVGCYDPEGNAAIPCVESTGQDGALRAGAVLAYTDNGDGTITDHATGLMWEKKDDDAGSVHDKDHEYPFADAVRLVSSQPGAPLPLDVLNNYCDDDETTPCVSDADCAGAANTYASNDRCGHAGYRDWRLPNVRELMSMVHYGTSSPTVAAVFHAACVPGCAVARCSCTAASGYWSSTAVHSNPSDAWFVDFQDGFVSGDFKPAASHLVRAVRGGP